MPGGEGQDLFVGLGQAGQGAEYGDALGGVFAHVGGGLFQPCSQFGFQRFAPGGLPEVVAQNVASDAEKPWQLRVAGDAVQTPPGHQEGLADYFLRELTSGATCRIAVHPRLVGVVERCEALMGVWQAGSFGWGQRS
jgi:hypothetical protein